MHSGNDNLFRVRDVNLFAVLISWLRLSLAQDLVAVTLRANKVQSEATKVSVK